MTEATVVAGQGTGPWYKQMTGKDRNIRRFMVVVDIRWHILW